MKSMKIGPNYDEMLNPMQLEEKYQKARELAKHDEFDPNNLFNITWKPNGTDVHKVLLPKALTGVDANIIVMLGKHFPSGSHKVGPAYATMIEGYIDGLIDPEKHTILGPSTGNFGIGVTYISHLLKMPSIVIMPDNMSAERYKRIKDYGGQLMLTPGTESDVILTLEKTHKLMKNPKYYALAQFELMPNYRFHRHVTGHSAISAVKGIGNERVRLFVSAPGSAGTLAAGDHLKTKFNECEIAAVEPYECSTLMNGGRGQHKIEGIGDKMCTLIHNVLNTDYLVLIKDDDSVKGLKVIYDGLEILKENGIDHDTAMALKDMFGVSGICNILASIKMAKKLKLTDADNIVTMATDGFDRYDSVLIDLEKREKTINHAVLSQWFDATFKGMDTADIKPVKDALSKEQLFKQKESDWLKFGYKKSYLDAMKDPAFWEEAYQKVEYYNTTIKTLRKEQI